MASQVKTIGQSGQVSLGKEFAGRTVVIDSPEEGVWIIRTARVMPDNELWLHEEPANSKITKGLAWASQTPAQPSKLDEFESELRAKWEEKHSEQLDD